MKLVFVHDHKFRLVKGKIYSTGGLSDEALSRYTENFGYTTVIARIIEEKNGEEKYSEIKNNNVVIKNGITIGKSGMKEEIKKSDCVIVRMPSFLGLKAINIAKKMNKPYLVEIVACPWDSLWNHSLKGKLIAPYMTKVMKVIAKDSSHVIYVTNEFLQKRYPTNGQNVSCSNVVLTKFNREVLTRRMEKIKLKSDKIIIGTTAAIDVRHKGQQYIIEALGRLKQQGITNYEYQLVGGGDSTHLKSVAKKYNVEDQVKFLGPKPHDKVFDWLDTVDLYVQPSRQEGLPRALIEAMSRAIPCFGAKTGGIPELLDNRFIFSNTKKNISEICLILLGFNKELMLEQAKINYENAQKYKKDFIEQRRVKFFEEFKNMI